MLAVIVGIFAFLAGIAIGTGLGFIVAHFIVRPEPNRSALQTSLDITNAAWEAERGMWAAALRGRTAGR